MPRKSEGIRLYLKHRKGRSAVWIIRDGQGVQSTGCGEGERQQAEQQLATYVMGKYTAPRTGGQLDKTLIADVMTLYLTEHAPKTRSQDFIKHTANPTIDWWGQKPLSKVNAKSCTDYVTWRMKQNVGDQTARHDLKTLRAAIGYYHRSEYGPLTALPIVSVPPMAPQRLNYFLTRKEVADRIRVAKRNPRWRHVVRQLLIGYYTGTRPGATLRLRWLASTTGGWFDLATETLHRRGEGEKQSKKSAPPCRIHRRLLPWLVRWKAADEAKGISYVVHYYGREVKKLRRSWAAVRSAAGATRKDSPHIMRHTCCTWLLQSGVDQYEVAGFVGMSVATLTEVYGHHSASFQKAASGRG